MIQQLSSNPVAQRFAQAPPGTALTATGPQDRVSLGSGLPGEVHEESHSSAPKWGLLALAAVAGSSALLSGCSQPAEQVQTQTQPQPVQNDAQHPQGLLSQAGVMNFELSPTQETRVDVVRQTHTETHTSTNSDGETETTTETVNDDYQPFGVYLGDGLFVDSDMNLSVVPDRIFHEPVIPQNFNHMDVTGPLGGWTKVSLDKSGSQVAIHQPLTPDMTVVKDNENSTTIHPWAHGPKSWQQFSDTTITRQGNVTTIHPWSHFNDITITRQDDGKIVVHQWGPKAFDTTITRQGDQVTVQPWGGGFSRTTISREGDQITVRSLGNKETISHKGNQLVSKPFLGFSSTVTHDGNGQFTLKEGLGWSTHVKVQ